MSFADAIRSGFANYVNFSTRAPRSEYWFWMLFVVIVGLCLSVLDQAVFPGFEWSPLYTVFSIAVFLPGVAVSVRRLHDVDHSGWWLLLYFTIIGILLLLYWAVTKGTEGDNRFGADLLGGAPALGTPDEAGDPL